MKRVITAILPLILIAQIPFHTANFLPSDWMKSFRFGLKWTEMMMNGYPGSADVSEEIPDGIVTTTVVLASAIPEFEFTAAQAEICNEQVKEQIRIAVEEARFINIQLKLERFPKIRRAQVL